MSKFNKEHPLRVVTLCSGYDSQLLGLDRIKENHPEFDYELVAWSEIEDSAIKAHNLLFPQYTCRNLGDMTKIDWSKVEDFDLLTYSTPCQSISQAGLRRGMEEGSGTRSSLLWYTRNAILEKKPKYLMMENVKGLITKTFRPQFFKWIAELESYGYSNYWQLLNSSQFGVPQHRDRVFMISILRDSEEEPDYAFPRPIPLEKSLEDVLEDDTDECFYLNEQQVRKFVDIYGIERLVDEYEESKRN